MNNQKKFILLFGIVFAVIIGLIELILYISCTDDILCFGLLVIPLLPGTLLNLSGTISIIVSLLFWFLLGSLIGFLVYKLKKKFDTIL